MAGFKILTVVGARPQFIKAIAITKVLQDFPEIDEVLIHTGQHYDAKMSQVFFEELGLPHEAYNLDLGALSQAQMTGSMMIKLEEIFLKEQPDAVLLYGDTNSTLASALTAAKLHIPVIHVEAGLRSRKKNRPEELNRIITDHVSSVLFPPTLESEKNLAREGIISDETIPFSPNNPVIANFGDVMYDNFKRLSLYLDAKTQILNAHNLTRDNFVILTIHRALNTDNTSKLAEILSAVNYISINFGVKVIFPVHPRTQKKLDLAELKSVKSEIECNPDFVICEPVSFLDMMVLQKFCKMIITDSGGVQKEASFFMKPCVVLFESTPWKELVEAKVVIETGSNKGRIIEAYSTFNTNKTWAFPQIFGNGNAAELMVATIHQFLSNYSTISNEFKFQ